MVWIWPRGRHLGTQCSPIRRIPTPLSSQDRVDCFVVMGIYSGPEVTRSLYPSLTSYSLLSLVKRMLPSYRRRILRPLKTIQQRGRRQLETLKAVRKSLTRFAASSNSPMIANTKSPSHEVNGNRWPPLLSRVYAEKKDMSLLDGAARAGSALLRYWYHSTRSSTL
jgi:hypothetical protein